MKQWVCIDNTGNELDLILNKVYFEIQSTFVDIDCILIKNEIGIVTEYYQPLRFITIEEWRDRKLNSIGI
jgi:hypothetical protein